MISFFPKATLANLAPILGGQARSAQGRSWHTISDDDGGEHSIPAQASIASVLPGAHGDE